MQNNKSMDTFVSNNKTVVHEALLKESDASYLKNVSKSALTYWFIDCEYHGVTNDFKYTHFYNKTDVDHHVEALIVAGYEPVTTTTLPTTTTTSTTSTTSTTPTTTTSTTTPKPTNPTVSSTTVKIENAINKIGGTTIAGKVKRSVTDLTTKLPHEIVFYSGSNLMSSNKQFNDESPFICNGSVVPLSMNNTYGYFSKSFTVKGKLIL